MSKPWRKWMARSYWQHRFDHWTRQRLQPNGSQSLGNRQLFVFPTRVGFFSCVVMILLWLLGTNYENNLVLALSYWLVAVFVVSIHHAYLNLRGLHLRHLQTSSCFAGSATRVQLMVKAALRTHFSLRLRVEGQPDERLSQLAKGQEQLVQLTMLAKQRGLFLAPRVVIESTYPLGWIRCWSRPDFAVEYVVYPRPLASEAPPLMALEGDEEGRISAQGDEEFQQIREYRPGDAPRRIAWKHSVRSDKLLTKEYGTTRSGQQMLAWDALPMMDIETKLSILCYWVVWFDRAGQSFGLQLPQQEIPIDSGSAHCQACLYALAAFNRPQPEVMSWS